MKSRIWSQSQFVCSRHLYFSSSNSCRRAASVAFRYAFSAPMTRDFSSSSAFATFFRSRHLLAATRLRSRSAWRPLSSSSAVVDAVPVEDFRLLARVLLAVELSGGSAVDFLRARLVRVVAVLGLSHISPRSPRELIEKAELGDISSGIWESIRVFSRGGGAKVGCHGGILRTSVDMVYGGYRESEYGP